MQQITNSHSAFKVFENLTRKPIEEFWIMGLRADKSIITKKCLFRGTVDFCPVHLRDIFRYVCKANCSSFVVAHNHPGSSPTPSEQDIELTHNIMKACQIFQVPLIDHIIVGKKDFASLYDLGKMDYGKLQ